MRFGDYNLLKVIFQEREEEAINQGAHPLTRVIWTIITFTLFLTVLHKLGVLAGVGCVVIILIISLMPLGMIIGVGIVENPKLGDPVYKVDLVSALLFFLLIVVILLVF